MTTSTPLITRWMVRLGPLDIDVLRARVTRRGIEVSLSTVEYRLLLLFALNPGRIITHADIREALWGDAAAFVEDNTIYVYMRRLREKIEDDPSCPRIIETMRGQGYLSRAKLCPSFSKPRLGDSPSISVSRRRDRARDGYVAGKEQRWHAS